VKFEKTYRDKFKWSLKHPKTICLAYLKAENFVIVCWGMLSSKHTLTRIVTDKMAFLGALMVEKT
jgi:hypothetical protein